MADFATAYAITNGNEGGWQNDNHDTGNAANGLGTYKGISSAKQPKWKGWQVVQAEIAKLPPQPHYDTKAYYEWVHILNSALAANAALQQMVADFYLANFWNANRLSELNCQGAANHVYDHSINRGQVTAAILLQKVIGVNPDGAIGPVTIKAANAMGDALESAYREARKADYLRLIANKPSLAQYRRTWLSRC